MSLPDNLAWPTDAAVAAVLPELAGTGATLRQVRAPAGHVAKRHSHPFEQFLYVVAGGGKLERETGTVTLAPGVVIHFAPDDWHSAVFEADTVKLGALLTQIGQDVGGFDLTIERDRTPSPPVRFE